MSILRVTTFKWGDSCHNWYPDEEAVKRQLAWEAEANRKRSPDVVNEQWYQATPIQKPEIGPRSGLDDSVHTHPDFRPN